MSSVVMPVANNIAWDAPWDFGCVMRELYLLRSGMVVVLVRAPRLPVCLRQDREDAWSHVSGSGPSLPNRRRRDAFWRRPARPGRPRQGVWGDQLAERKIWPQPAAAGVGCCHSLTANEHLCWNG